LTHRRLPAAAFAVKVAARSPDSCDTDHSSRIPIVANFLNIHIFFTNIDWLEKLATLISQGEIRDEIRSSHRNWSA